MVAVPEECTSAPKVESGPGRLPLLTHCHRAVAVVESPVELLRPESDLLRVGAGIDEIDVLVAVHNGPPESSDVDTDADRYRAELAADVERLGRAGLRVHHLELSGPLGAPAEPDLVAALSELVGFDPEPGVCFLAPVPAPGDVGRTVLTAAARRIAQVYGLPLLRYRCLELAVVPDPRPAGAG